MNTLIQPQIELELTDEQLASISGGIGHEHEEHDRGRMGDDDDRRENHWDDDDRHGWGNHWHHRGHWAWNRWRHEWVWVNF